MRRLRNYRHKYWVHALIVGVLLTGQMHLYCAEIFHHHADEAPVCRNSHGGGTYLHTAPDLTPVCPLCQIARSGSVRPAVQSLLPKPQGESFFKPAARQERFSPILTQSLLARAPPLS